MPDSPVFNCEKCECGNILLLKERTECVYTIIGTGKNPPLFQHALPDDGRSAIFSEWSFFFAVFSVNIHFCRKRSGFGHNIVIK